MSQKFWKLFVVVAVSTAFSMSLSVASVAAQNKQVLEAKPQVVAEEIRMETLNSGVRQPVAPAEFRPGDRNVGSPGKVSNAKPKQNVKVEFANNASVPVLTMDVTGGYRRRQPKGFVPTPLLQIYSDGRIVTGRKSPLVKEIESSIDPVELKSLLVYVVDDCRFFDFTTESIKADVEKLNRGKLMDAGTTSFSVNLEDHQNSVSVYGMSLAARGAKAAPESVAAMLAIASRCRKLIAMTRIGSEEEAGAALHAVNQSLAEQYPDVEKFTLDNIQFAEQFIDGRRSVSLLQYQKDDKGGTKMVYGTYDLSAAGKQSVTVSALDQ